MTISRDRSFTQSRRLAQAPLTSMCSPLDVRLEQAGAFKGRLTALVQESQSHQPAEEAACDLTTFRRRPAPPCPPGGPSQASAACGTVSSTRSSACTMRGSKCVPDRRRISPSASARGHARL